MKKINRIFAALLSLVILAGTFPRTVSATPDDASFEKLEVFSLKDVTEFSSLPIISLEIKDGAPLEREDKEIIQQASLSVINSDIPGGDIRLEAVGEDFPVSLHGRGNSSWSGVGTGKKSYTLKLSKAQPLLGMAKAKSWCLISNWVDTTYMRNYVAYKAARELGIPAPDCALCELCVNGEYEGIYLLCESVQLHKSRVVTAGDGSDENGDGETEQFLLEARCDWKEPGFWADRAEIYFHVKDTGSGDDPSDSEINYLTNYMNVLNKRIMKGEGYEEYMDVDSFIDTYLINEAFKNPDFGYGYQHYYSSTFCYMEEGGKLYFGPLWDFDISMGRNCFDNVEEEENRPTMHPTGVLSGSTKWVADLMKNEDFAARMAERWAELSPRLRTLVPELIEQADSRLLPSVIYDVKTWGGVEGRCTWWNYRMAKGYAQEKKYILEWNAKRFDWLDGYFLSGEYVTAPDNGAFDGIGDFFVKLWNRLTSFFSS